VTGGHGDSPTGRRIFLADNERTRRDRFGFCGQSACSREFAKLGGWQVGMFGCLKKRTPGQGATSDMVAEKRSEKEPNQQKNEGAD